VAIEITNWPGPDAADTLSFLRQASAWIRTNAMRSDDPRLRARAELFASHVYGEITENSSRAEMAATLNDYDSIRAALGTSAYEAPPIEVAVPAATRTGAIGRGTGFAPPAELDAARLPALATEAQSLLIAGDPLRNAIVQTADWWAHVSWPVATIEGLRARRLSAWFTAQLAMIRARTAAQLPPAGPVHLPRAVPEAPGQPGVPASQAQGGGDTGKVVAFLLALWALSKMGKKGRR